MWIENKLVQLSIAGGPKVDPKEIHRLCSIAWKDFHVRSRILEHHLGIDVIPRGWSKSKATDHFISSINQELYDWHIFGDNQSDREMMKGLSSVSFHSTRKFASDDVWGVLKELKLLDHFQSVYS